MASPSYQARLTFSRIEASRAVSGSSVGSTQAAFPSQRAVRRHTRFLPRYQATSDARRLRMPKVGMASGSTPNASAEISMHLRIVSRPSTSAEGSRSA